MTVYVPTFQGLSAIDFVRPPRRAAACFPFDAPRLGFYRARNAIYYLFKALGGLKPRLVVLVPDYNSGNEVLALQAAGATLHFYRIGRDLQPDVEQIEALCLKHDSDVLYVIHYLGWPQPLEPLAALCRRRRMLLVEDCALSLLSAPGGRSLGAGGDFSVFCLYKTLPVPNGALLVQNTMPLDALDRLRFRQAGTVSVLGRVAELMAQRARARLNGVGAVLQTAKRAVGRAATAIDVHRTTVGDIGFTLADADLGMSGATGRLLRRFDFSRIHQARAANFHALAQAAKGYITPLQPALPDGACPLFLPIVVADKTAAARALRAQGVQALEFWNHGAGGMVDGGADARYLRTHVLALPVHQDLSRRHVEHMASRLAALSSQLAA
jgi:dTDP-4-amino-4,6-dideoxygalactose transaminase